MLLELNFSAVAQAEKIIQEMQEKIDACRSLEDRAVAHLEVSRELSKSLTDNGLSEKGFSDYKSTLSEIWGLENSPIDVKGLVLKLEHTQHELASLDQEYEQLKYEKQEVESKLSMTVESNKELLLQKQKLENKIKELEELTDSLDNSQQSGLVHEDNLEIVRAGHLLTQEVNELKSQLEKLTAENNFYSQENASLKKQKLEWVVNKDENEKVAQLESKIAELESENQSLEWQKSKAVAMVEEKAEQAIPQARDWKVNDIVQVIGSGETVTIVGYSSDQKQGHFVCQMPDGETKKEYFTGQLRFVQSGTNDIQTPQMDSQLTLELGESHNTEKEQDKSGVEFVSPIIPAQERADEFINSYQMKATSWEDFLLVANNDPEVLRDISSSSTAKGKKVKHALPFLAADYQVRTGKLDLTWTKSPRFEAAVQEAMDEVVLQKSAVEFFATHNSPKKLGNLKWETLREYAQGDPKKIDALIKIANASGKENSKTRFCDSLENLCADYIKRTVSEENPQGDRSDLGWVPFANLVLTKLGESLTEDANGQQAAPPDWDKKASELVEIFLKQDTSVGANALGVKRMLREVWGQYPEDVDAIASRMLELISERENSSVIFEWVEQAHLEYQKSDEENVPLWEEKVRQTIESLTSCQSLTPPRVRTQIQVLFASYPEQSKLIVQLALSIAREAQNTEVLQIWIQSAYENWCEKSLFVAA